MTTSSVEGVSNGIFAPANAASVDTSGTSEDSDMFLQLMVAQLKYQDPMNPTDSSTMLTQNATFTEVQSMQEMQSEMEELLSSQLAFGAASMIGKQVSWTDSDGNAQTGTVAGTTFTASGPTLSVNGSDIPMTSVTDVAPASSTSGTASTTASTTSQS